MIRFLRLNRRKAEKLRCSENDRLLKGKGEDSLLPDAGVRTPRRVPNRDLRRCSSSQRAMTTEKHSESEHTGTPSNSARQLMDLPRDARGFPPAYAESCRGHRDAHLYRLNVYL